jgi:uncharacterized protein
MARWVRRFLVVALGLAALAAGARTWLVHHFESALLARRAHPPLAPLPVEGPILVREEWVAVGADRMKARWVQPAGQPTWGQVFIAHGGQPEWIEDWRGAQRALAARGLGSFIFDYVGFGTSSGAADRHSMVRDTAAAWRSFEATTSPGTPIAALGFSGGCHCLLANPEALAQRARAAVLVNCFSSIRDFLADSGRLRPPWHHLIPDVFNNKAAAAAFPLPTLQIHGSTDEMATPSRAREVFDRLAGPKQFLEVPGLRHNDPVRLTPEAVWQPVESFLRAQLGSG